MNSNMPPRNASQGWIAGCGVGARRRRIMAILRMAHRVLGLRRNNLGLGQLGMTGGAAASLAITLVAAQPTASFANVILGNPGCASAGPVFPIGRFIPPNTTSNPTDGAGTWATVAGCNATGFGQNAVTVFGTFSSATGEGGATFGFMSTAGKWSLATGLQATANGTSSTAVGFGSIASNLNSVAIGGAGGDGTTPLSVANSTTASGSGAIAIGSNSIKGAQAAGNDAIAIGGQSSVIATASSGVALGRSATVNGTGGIALGAGATANNTNDVALGAGSTTSTPNATASGVIDGKSYTYAGAAPGSVVSVGAPNAERQVTNVAAGQVSANSTDAVNGSQLFATNTAIGTLSGRVSSLGADVATNFGGGATYDSTTGHVSAPNYVIGGTGYSDVGSAFSAVNTTLGSNSSAIAALQTDALQWNTVTGSYDASHGTASPQKISNVANGAAATDAVNKGQLDAVGATASAGWNISAQGANTTNVAPGTSVDLRNSDGNLVVSKTAGSNDVTFNLSPNVTATSFTAGNSRVDSNGLTITGGPSVTASGIDAAGQRITNVAPGTVSAASSDAVNGAQLFTTNQSVATVSTNTSAALGGGADIANGVAPSYTVQGSAYNNVGSAIGAVDSNLTTLNNSVSSGSVGVVQRTGNANETALTAAGGSGAAPGAAQRLTNLANGTVSATSTDAVNGSQLFATNQNVTTVTDQVSTLGGDVATALGGGASYNSATGAMTAPSYTIGAGTYNDVGSAFGAVNATLGSNSTAIIALQSDALQWNTALGAYDASHGSGSPQKITSVAAGAVSAGSTDAVNGSQLYAISATASAGWNLTANGANSSNVAPSGTVDLNNTDGNVAIAKTGNAVTFNLAPDVTATSFTAGNSRLDTNGLFIAGGPSVLASGINAGGMTITNVGAGGLSATSTDAVNGAQLYVTNQNVAGNTTAITTLQSAALQWNTTLGAYDASHGTASPQKITNVAAGTAATDAVNKGQLDAVSTNVANLDDRAVRYDGNLGDLRGIITLAGTSGTRITNLTAGSVSPSSTDAINGGQLYGISQSVATALGGGSIVNGNGTISAPSYTIQGSTYTNVGSAFGAVDSRLTSISNQLSSIGGGGNSTYFHANSTSPDSQTTGTDSVAIGPASVASGTGSFAAGHGATSSGDNAIAVGSNANAGQNGAVALGQNATATNAGDVALGSGSKTQAAVATTGTTINGQSYSFAGTAPTSTVSVGDINAERTVTNVAAGRVSATSTDAVNGSQLFATNQAVEAMSSSVGTLSQNAVRYDTNPDGSKKNSITLQGGDPNAPVLISNVAAGVADTDAVNVRQLKTGMSTTLASANTYTDTRTAHAISTANTYTDQRSAQTLSQANNYTDQKFGMLSGAIGEVRSEARQAAAIGLAASSLRYDDRPGKVSAAVGGGVWRDEGAFAMGVGYTSEDQRVRANFSATTSGGQWGAGAGLNLTLN